MRAPEQLDEPPRSRDHRHARTNDRHVAHGRHSRKPSPLHAGESRRRREGHRRDRCHAQACRDEATDEREVTHFHGGSERDALGPARRFDVRSEPRSALQRDQALTPKLRDRDRRLPPMAPSQWKQEIDPRFEKHFDRQTVAGGVFLAEHGQGEIDLAAADGLDEPRSWAFEDLNLEKRFLPEKAG